MPAHRKRVAKKRVAPKKRKNPVLNAKRRIQRSRAGRGTIGQLARAGASYLGGKALESAGSYFGSIFGKGAYKLNSNSLMHGVEQVPNMHGANEGVRVRHREYLQDISSSIAFTNLVYNVNPGLASTFPWLSALAQNFEEYRMNGLVFEYKTTSVDALTATNAALGTIILAADYNAASPSFVNKQQMENAMWSNSTKPSCSMIMPIECSPQLNPLSNMYIRTGAVPSGQDQRLYDLCNVQLGAVGSQAAFVAGELWVSYDVTLKKPILESAIGQNVLSAHYQMNSVAVTTAYFGTSQTLVIDNIGLTFNGTMATFPAGTQGKFLLSYSVTGTSASVSAPSFSFSSGIAGVMTSFTGGTVSYKSNSGDTSTVYVINDIFNVTYGNVAQTITASGGTLPTAATSADLIITQLDDSFA